MKPLFIVILLVCIISACQKKDNSVAQSGTPTYHIVDTPIRKIDSSSYYSAVYSTAFFAGVNCDSFNTGMYENIFSFQDTIMVIRYAPDSIRILEKHLLLHTSDFYQINTDNFYKSYESDGYSAFTFSSADSLCFKSKHDNPCSSGNDSYNYTFKGKRYK